MFNGPSKPNAIVRSLIWNCLIVWKNYYKREEVNLLNLKSEKYAVIFNSIRKYILLIKIVFIVK